MFDFTLLYHDLIIYIHYDYTIECLLVSSIAIGYLSTVSNFLHICAFLKYISVKQRMNLFRTVWKTNIYNFKACGNPCVVRYHMLLHILCLPRLWAKQNLHPVHAIYININLVLPYQLINLHCKLCLTIMQFALEFHQKAQINTHDELMWIMVIIIYSLCGGFGVLFFYFRSI